MKTLSLKHLFDGLLVPESCFMMFYDPVLNLLLYYIDIILYFFLEIDIIYIIYTIYAKYIHILHPITTSSSGAARTTKSRTSFDDAVRQTCRLLLSVQEKMACLES